MTAFDVGMLIGACALLAVGVVFGERSKRRSRDRLAEVRKRAAEEWRDGLR